MAAVGLEDDDDDVVMTYGGDDDEEEEKDNTDCNGKKWQGMSILRDS
jgi:hypothetical protein